MLPRRQNQDVHVVGGPLPCAARDQNRAICRQDLGFAKKYNTLIGLHSFAPENIPDTASRDATTRVCSAVIRPPGVVLCKPINKNEKLYPDAFAGILVFK